MTFHFHLVFLGVALFMSTFLLLKVLDHYSNADAAPIFGAEVVVAVIAWALWAWFYLHP